MIPDLTPELTDLINRISQRNGYYGNRIPASIMAQFEIETREDGAGILVPFWLPVIEKGRGPRKGTRSYDLYKKIYRWMEARGMFKSDTAKGRLNEAKSMTWYINKYGNAHFRSKIFIDVYETERQKTVEQVERKYLLELNKVMIGII